MTGKTILLSTAYLAPVGYFAALLSANSVLIELRENYIKQTFRNRCLIMGANGPQMLSVPVKRGSSHKTAVKSIEIDYTRRWRSIHSKAIESAYRSAPFFEFYADEIFEIIDRRHSLLIDLNNNLIDRIMQLLKVDVSYAFTKEFVSPINNNYNDLRYSVSPKSVNRYKRVVNFKQYNQVFAERWGFTPDMSIIDLLFNTGPDAVLFLELTAASFNTKKEPS